MNNKKEVVVCAAIVLYRDEEDCEGITVAGITYEQCLSLVDDLSHEHYDTCGEGFMTNYGRYVNKYEALELTGMQNQLRFQSRKYLLPEDLY